MGGAASAVGKGRSESLESQRSSGECPESTLSTAGTGQALQAFHGSHTDYETQNYVAVSPLENRGIEPIEEDRELKSFDNMSAGAKSFDRDELIQATTGRKSFDNMPAKSKIMPEGRTSFDKALVLPSYPQRPQGQDQASPGYTGPSWTNAPINMMGFKQQADQDNMLIRRGKGDEGSRQTSSDYPLGAHRTSSATQSRKTASESRLGKSPKKNIGNTDERISFCNDDQDSSPRRRIHPQNFSSSGSGASDKSTGKSPKGHRIRSASNDKVTDDLRPSFFSESSYGATTKSASTFTSFDAEDMRSSFASGDEYFVRPLNNASRQQLPFLSGSGFDDGDGEPRGPPRDFRTEH